MNTSFAEIAIMNIDTAINTIGSISDNTYFKEMQTTISVVIHNAVHSIVDCYERMDMNCLTEEEDRLLRAFMYVNNQLKHDKSLSIITYNVSGSMFPLFFPFRFGPPGVSWKDFPNNGREQARGRRNHYEEMLMNKDVSRTLKEVKEILSCHCLRDNTGDHP